MMSNRLTEKQLRKAAALAEAYTMRHLPDDVPHQFSTQFEHNMDELCSSFADGQIRTARIRMGWQYYARRGVAAVLLGAVLTGIAMPEAVVAGYHKIIETVEQFRLDDARIVIHTEYTDISAPTDFAADDTYLYYQGQEGEIYRRPLAQLTVDSQRLQLMTVDENDTFDDYAIGRLYEQNGSIYLYYYTGGGIMGSGHQYRLYPDGTVESVFRGKYSYFDFGEMQILATEYPSLMPEPMTRIDNTGTAALGDAEYFYRAGSAGDGGYTLKPARVAYWNDTLYALAFRYGEASHICKVDPRTGATTPLSQYSTDNFELAGGRAYYVCAYRENGTTEDDFRVKHLYMLNVKTGKEQYVGTIKWDADAQDSCYEPAENGVYYIDCDTEELVFYNSAKKTAAAINTGAAVEQLYRQNDYIVAHFAEGTAGTYRLMVFDKSGTVYTSHEISDKAAINQNGVMIYRIAGTSRLVKAELQ